VLLHQHLLLVLVFKLKLCCSLSRWMGNVVLFFLCLSAAAAWSAPPSVRYGRLSFYVVLKFQRSALEPTSCPTVWSAECLPSRFVAALLFSQCSVAWRSFLWARGSGCRSFDPWGFISIKCGSSISVRFLIHGAHAVCFCTLVAILVPPHLVKRSHSFS
jgi:hypothetical protein